MDNTEMFTLRFASYPSFEAIQHYFSKIDIYLSIIPDGFKYDRSCWRGVMNFKYNNEWDWDDCGSYDLPHDCKEPLIRMAVEYCLKNNINFLNIE